MPILGVIRMLSAFPRLLLLSAIYLGSKTKAAKPHVVFFLVDDLGYNDVGYQDSNRSQLASFNSTNAIKSPNIDSLAQSGIVLTDYYVYKYCSPSRSQILSGRYAYHVGQNDGNLGNSTKDPCGLSTAYSLLPAMLKRGGYSTHHVGKWNQGFYAPRFTPTRRGFDTFFGFYDGGESHFTHITPFAVWRKGVPYWWTPGSTNNSAWETAGGLVDLSNNTVGQPLQPASSNLNGTFSVDLSAREAILRVQAHPDPHIPFFLYLAFHGVHTPLDAPDHYVEPFKATIMDRDRLIMAGMISAVDTAIGNVTDALKGRGMWTNTLIILSTDNGGPICYNPDPSTQRGEKIVRGCGTNNSPLRGSKMTYWEGGVRGIGLVSGPLIPHSAQGHKWSGLMSQTDWFPTILGLAGLTPSEIKASGPVDVDGIDQWSALTTLSKSPRTEVVHNINGNNSGSIRVGPWKLLKGYPGQKTYNAFDGWASPPELPGGPHFEPSPVAQACSTYCLFNVVEDPEERIDRSASDPAQLKIMLDRYAELQKSEITRSEAKLCNESSAIPDGYLTNRAKGVWEPWAELEE